MADDTEVVTITRKEYDLLLERDDFLSCLEVMGVDNWCGYDEACELSTEPVDETTS